jgi:hypothetical protein
MGVEAIKSLAKYICDNIRNNNLRDATTGLITLKKMTKNEDLIRKINNLIVRLQEREKILDEELDAFIASLSPEPAMK